jgi:hypothetical protein
MKAVLLQLQVNRVGQDLSVLLDSDWIYYILRKGFDVVFYVDYMEGHLGRPSTWLVQKKQAPCTFKNQSITDWLPTRFDQIDALKGNHYWFSNSKEEKDCLEEIKNFFMRSGFELIELDLRGIRNTDGIDAILAKLVL